MPLPFETRELEIVERLAVPVSGTPERSAAEMLSGCFVVVDKPAGCTSHDVVDEVRRITGLRKCGHTGTLDPMVTGVLPVAVGRATRTVSFLLDGGKVYLAEMTLHADVNENALRDALKAMKGAIEQVPPVRSRVKRVTRRREIYEIDLIEMKGRKVVFRVACQGGTYVRKLIHDMGEKLGSGAHMSGLRREQAGPFNLGDAVALEEFERIFLEWKAGEDEEKNQSEILEILRAPEDALRIIPWVWVSEELRKPVSHGTDVYLPGVICYHHPAGAGEKVAVVSDGGELFALGELALDTGLIREREKGVAVKTTKVFVD